MSLQISPAQPADTDACARLLARAFVDDAVLALFIRGTARREERLRAYFAAMLAAASIPAGTVDVARREPGGEIVGVGEWHGPGAVPGERRRALRALPRTLRAIGLRHVVPVVRTEAIFRRFVPPFDHWYLAHLAVAPQARGLGVGSALLARGLARVDAAALPAYLEATSATNGRLYQRHGFRPVAAIELTSDRHATAMLRPAAPAR